MKSSNANENESVVARVRVVAEIPLPSPLRRRCLISQSDHVQHVSPQPLALCETSGVVAIANGPVVDLYLMNSSSAATTSASSSPDDGSEHSGDRSAAESGGHISFLMQIALDEYKDIRGYAQKSSAGEEQSVMVATCVCFVAPGVLLVGAAKLQGEQGAAESSLSTWLFGFRVYVNELVHHRKSDAFLGTSRSHPQDPAMVQFSFLERILLREANGIASMQVCRHCTNLQSGAIVMVMNNSSGFGVFQWRERFSDRQVCIAELPDCDTTLIAAATSSDGQWCALSDAIGYLYLLSFETFEWFGAPTNHRQHQTGEDKLHLAMLAAKRLRDASCSRSGILMRDNPLDSVRLASVSGESRVTHEYSVNEQVLALREKQDQADHVRWVLEAKQASRYYVIYPGVSEQRFDPVRQIYAQFETSSLQHGFQLFSMSDTIGKYWELKADANGSSKPKRMKWPSIKEFFEFPTLSSGQSVEGIFAVSQPSNRLWDLLWASVNERNREDWDGWMVVVMTVTSLQLLVMEIQPQRSTSHPDLLLKASAGSINIEDTQELDDHRNEDGEESWGTADYPQNKEQEDEKRQVTVMTTIQEKYRLPQASWKADSQSESEKENQGPQVAGDPSKAPPGKDVRFDRKTKMTAAEYGQRVQLAAERVERLSSNLKMLRNSFQLFTKDVQTHMSDISEQLELAARLRHSRDPQSRQ